jgi:hypothetical protein
MMHSVVGYFAAFFARMLPRLVAGDIPPIEARIVNMGQAYYVDPRRGDRLEEIEPGAKLFEGPASLISVGTSSFFGYNFKIFPFAGLMPGMMQLRVTNISALGALAHLPSIWKGTYRNPEVIRDFLVKDVWIDLQTPYPFQHSGDDQGLRDHLHFEIDEKNPLKLVDFHRTF